MGWFDEQLRERRKKDNENFEAAMKNIAGAVLGKKLANALNESDAALSALDEVLKYYHIVDKDIQIPSGVEYVEDQIDYRLRPHGIMRRNVKLESGWYKYAIGPMLGYEAESEKAVALIPGKISGYYMVDTSTGEKTKINRKNESLIDEDAVCFYESLPQRALTVKDLVVFMGHQLSVSDVFWYLLLMALSTALGMIGPHITNILFGTVLESNSIKILMAFAIFMICYSLSQVIFGAFNTLMNGRINVKQDIAVEAAVMSRVMSLPPRFFKDYASGELSQRAQYVQSLCETLFNSIGQTGLTAVFSLAYIGQVFKYAPTLVAPSVCITIISLILSTITTLTQIKISREKMELSSKESGMAYAMISGVQKIKLSGAEKRMFSRWANLYSKQAMLNYNPPTFLKLSGTISSGLMLMGTALMYFLAIKSGISVADYYAFNSAYGMLSGAFMSLAGMALTIANIKPIMDMAEPILKAVPEQDSKCEIITRLSGNIELSNVSFRYSEDMPDVIDDLSLKIHAGEYLAIVGATGCGKTTLMRLLLGFEKPRKGSIYYDRKDISNIDLRSLRRKMGIVLQDGKLFFGDIFDNITISAPQLTMEDAWEAARIACIDEDINNMPMGMSTIIAEGQGGISGGQKQRLMIARAIAAKPKILMFDEATSALDNITQKKISEAIDSLDCTRIVIAHRLSTIKHCDRIIVLDAGHIVEDGKYDELISHNGYFAELVRRQRLDVNLEEQVD